MNQNNGMMINENNHNANGGEMINMWDQIGSNEQSSNGGYQASQTSGQGNKKSNYPVNFHNLFKEVIVEDESEIIGPGGSNENQARNAS